jgi:hypothetical protein
MLKTALSVATDVCEHLFVALQLQRATASSPDTLEHPVQEEDGVPCACHVYLSGVAYSAREMRAHQRCVVVATKAERQYAPPQVHT